MKKSIASAIIIAAILAGVAITNQTAATQPKPSLQRDVLILQADQLTLYASDGMGNISWGQTEFFVVRSHGSSGAPVYPTYLYGDALKVSGHTNTIVPLAQALADLRSTGWRLVSADAKTYTLEKP